MSNPVQEAVLRQRKFNLLLGVLGLFLGGALIMWAMVGAAQRHETKLWAVGVLSVLSGLAAVVSGLNKSKVLKRLREGALKTYSVAQVVSQGQKPTGRYNVRATFDDGQEFEFPPLCESEMKLLTDHLEQRGVQRS